ncbi:hypothetical protein SMACR_08368 [Sordaria macrospora]|uniref:WGS project CABT00000000 data, contig 2.28 n=2 Tax=Sordaria macrospora TaxID=5147 RepID=F7W4U0_SORMK|nr:uncharacterized protein SMAC_08368 [Sordaria macrospora k-hell]KAA8631384.1 hypothetical protein SMACR_08368 [Sordaria macrospora]KAH7633418.1 hypothetical protein B0T09DRAFT_355385 [Sordaria sp. MPI-SDFR-AT-0083]WPJ60177.1 hypothetical protein SMAC4_08368 [Sordaria macrospora]CCC12527.1 unnamed protein product [Sordaria macrospora k-hell]
MANRESLPNTGTGNTPISVSGLQSRQRTAAAVVRFIRCPSPYRTRNPFNFPFHFHQGLAPLGGGYLLQEKEPLELVAHTPPTQHYEDEADITYYGSSYRLFTFAVQAVAPRTTRQPKTNGQQTVRLFARSASTASSLANRYPGLEETAGLEYHGGLTTA